eukprot:CAMPEP_0178980594 /NCGR_PEP_ID=MMETSP0789-20121207/26585_1 /TAXON_ID=3005 /ORGANISM="Rhizosolenia setigera, Strain CCMP 1694" /LENGTH=222 /DNA_ID=CAMNT_0020671029 /DNA_START=285 /DNA_END=950 /DNA_ORIENTATION=-
MTKETFLFGSAPLSVIQDRIKRAIQAIQDKCMSADFIFQCKRERFSKILEPVGKVVVLYHRSDVLDWALQKRNKDVLRVVCEVAAGEGRIDVLEEVWNNFDDEDDKRFIFRDLHEYAARHGKLNVLKWLETTGVSFGKQCAREAARHGHLHILQWLREERGFEIKRLSGLLYYSAIVDGGHLHVMKWLQEQEVPWDRYNFACAARRGNLDILQWLHNEGCPW